MICLIWWFGGLFCFSNRGTNTQISAYKANQQYAAGENSAFEDHPPTKSWESCLWTLWFNTCMNRKVKINQPLGTAEESFAPGAVWKKNTPTSEGLQATNIDSTIELNWNNRSMHQLLIYYAERNACRVSSWRGCSFPLPCAVVRNQNPGHVHALMKATRPKR